MENVAWYLGIAVFAGCAIALQLSISGGRHAEDHRRDLEPILARYGLSFVSARWPGAFKVGPFPIFERGSSTVQTEILGVSGEYHEYRIVTATDSQGNTHELWAHLEFEAFHLRRVRWRADRNQDLPSAASALLEKSNR